MPSSITAIARQAQDVKAQSLSTLMATLDAVQPASRVGATLSGNPEATLQAVEAAVRAVLIEAQPNGKALLQVAGTLIEADLPPELLRAAAGNPNLLRPGTTLMLPASLLARPAPQPATLVTLTGTASGSSVSSPPPLTNLFPPGTLGALISRLTGIAFPQAEPLAVTRGMTTATALRPGIPAQMSPAPTSPAQPLPAELAHPLLNAIARQMPLAPALTQILALPEATLAALPPQLQQALRALQNARATPETLQTANGLREAVARSGLFLEANLASQSTGVPTSTPDLKALLLALRASLAGTGLEAQDPAEPATLRARLNGEQAGRPPAMREAGDTMRLPEMARAVEGALERVKLMQLASLPDHPEVRVTDDRPQGMRLAISLPLALHGTDRPQTAVMGLVIDHQPAALEVAPYEPETDAENAGEAFPWKVRLALDLEETGPIQAEIALRGQAVAVTFWAERHTTADRARNEIGTLHDALTEAAFEVLKLDVRDGRPHGQLPRTRPMLDRRT
jgi:hypothetical protein